MIALLIPPAALAWSVPQDLPHSTGEAGAREVWRGEHPDLYAEALAAAGLSVLGRTYTVWTRGGPSADTEATLQPPSAWALVQASQTRLTALDMWANLPDVSWSVADWAAGNELCPLDASGYSVTTSTCHGFLTGWMGALNSHHFVPQSYHAWSWYHTLALETAARCADLREDLSSLGYAPDSEYGELITGLLRQCEEEALIFEGVGHHYLQDAFSSGHTWQRWGSPDLSFWKDNASSSGYTALPWALTVGGLSGLIHGTGREPDGVPDPLCGPNPNVEVIPAGGGPDERLGMVGDYYLGRIAGTEQETLLTQCTHGSLAEVVTALGDSTLGLSAPSDGVTPDEATCFGLRATNLAWATGYRTTSDLPTHFRVLARLGVLSEEEVEEADWALRRDLVRLAFLSEAVQFQDGGPYATDLAELTLTLDDGSTTRLSYFGAAPNDTYTGALSGGLLTLDPPAEVLAGGAGTEQQEQDADRLRRTFHRAHADFWCADPEGLGADPEDPDSDLSQLREVCRTGTSSAWAGEELREDEDTLQQAACDLCAEFALRHHRVGSGPDDYDGAQEPVCAALGGDEFLYLPVPEGSTRAEVVEAWCSATPAYAVTSTGVWQFDPSATTGDLASSATLLSSSPTDANGLAAWQGRVFLSTDSALLELGEDGSSADFLPAGCTGPQGLEVDADAAALYVVCEDTDLLLSFDLGTSPPTELDRLELLTVTDGSSSVDVVEEPRALALHPEGGWLAVVSDEIYAQKDGITLVILAAGTFGGAQRIPPRIDSYDFDDYGCRAYCEAAYDPSDPEFYFLYWDCLADCSDFVTDIEGLYYSACRGVDWSADGALLFASNFSNMECLTPNNPSCEIQSDYWVSVADPAGLELVDAPVAPGRTSPVQRVGEHVVVGEWTAGDLLIFAAGGGRVGTLSTGGQRLQSLAATPGGERLFAAFDDASSTCGLAVVDTADADPSAWTLEGVDSGLGCVRRVAVGE